MEWKNIIGKGAVAQVVKQTRRVNKLFFASGVSNSQEQRKSEYQREINLLLKQDRKKHLVYFSSLSVFYPQKEYNRYIQHKRDMEGLVKTHFSKYTIIRLGNISWENDNPYTIINFLKNKIERGEPYEVRDVYRYLVSKEEFLYWINLIPEWSAELSIPGRRIKVAQIVKEIKAGKL